MAEEVDMDEDAVKEKIPRILDGTYLEWDFHRFIKQANVAHKNNKLYWTNNRLVGKWKRNYEFDK